jgi:rubrerythrin
MVSTIEKQTSSRHLHQCIEEEKEEREISNFYETHQKILDEKSIMQVQICYRCGRKFPFKKGRKNCPYCEGLLRTNVVMLKVSRF